LLAAYGEHTYRPLEALALSGGGRLQVDVRRAQASGSGRLAAALTLPWLMVLKLSLGTQLQPVQTALALDPVAGNPALSPEQSTSLIAGLEQPLPFEALLRVEAWAKWYAGLVVNPDTRAGLEARQANGLPAFTNGGAGLAQGVDAMLVGRVSQLAYSVGLGVLTSDRTNPLASGRATYPVQWEQQLSAGAGLSWSPSSRWLATAHASFRLGRPYTPIEGFELDPTGRFWVPRYGETSSARYPFFFELSARGEHRFPWGPLQCAVYLEVLNLTNTMNVFSWVYGPGDVAGGVPPSQGRFTHLPIRPFLGFRAEY
jgi:hypothetical protein